MRYVCIHSANMPVNVYIGSQMLIGGTIFHADAQLSDYYFRYVLLFYD